MSTPQTSKRRLALAGAVVASVVPIVAAEHGAFGIGTTSGTVSGLVFNDYNSDGAFEDDPNVLVNDAGLAGVEVRAFDADGDPVGTAVTDADGLYTLNVVDANSDDIRIEFETPDGFESSFAGPDNGSSVQFVSIDAADVSYAVLRPADYCQNNPDLALTCFRTTGAGQTVSIFPYESGTASRTSNNGVASSPLGEGSGNSTTGAATADQVGPTRGLAYFAETEALFAAAYVKRGSAFPSQTAGSDDPDRIYLVPTDGVSAPTVFLDSIDAGVDTHNYTDFVDVNNLGELQDDEGVWPSVARSGWGDIDLDEAQENLYAVNLFDKKIYEVPVDASSGTPVAGAPTGFDLEALTNVATACSDGEWVPGAMKVHDGLVYVSATCTANTSQDTADLQGFIYALDPAGPTATQVAQFDLDYDRGEVLDSQNMPAEFQPWIEAQPTINGSGGLNPPGGPATRFGYYPMPWVTDIEFADDDNMIVGVNDRMGDLGGHPGGVSGEFETIAAGDTLLLTATAGSWTLIAGDDEHFEDPFPLTSGAHDDITLGSLVVVPGSNQVISSSIDPAPVHPAAVNTIDGSTQLFPRSVRSGGVIYLNQETGLRERAFQVYGQDDVGTFGKATGIGDLEALCDRAPVQVGNHVWEDVDGDGIQDPGEAPIADVTVSLYDSNGVLVGTAITAADGSYFFSSDLTPAESDDPSSTEPAAGDGDNAGGGLVPGGGGFQIRFDNPVDYADGGPLAGFVLTDADQGSSELTDVDDAIDSDATTINGFPTIPFSAPEPGENDHTFDAGFYEGLELGDEVFFDTNNSGDIDAGDLPVPDGVVVNLLDENGDVVDTTTTTSGMYLFTGLTARDYVVQIPASEFADGALLAGYSASTGPAASTDPNDDIEDDSESIAVAGGVQSGTVTLTVGGEPTDDLEPTTGANDADSNLTVDLGLIPGLELGDEVFFDTNNSGDIDAGDLPVPDGVVVNLLDENGDVVASTTTTGGKYLFTGLAPDDYVVQIPASQFADGAPLAGYSASTGPAASTNPNDDVEDNSDAVASAGGGIQSGTITLTVGGEPTNDLDPNAVGDADSNLTVDLGLVPGLELGNQVWIDADNNGVLDSGEVAVAGVTVELLDSSGAVVATTTTDADGAYLFSGLAAGDYVVSIPASNFADGAPLAGFHPSTGPGSSTDPNDDVDSNSDGIAQSNGSVQSGTVTLDYGSEPVGEDVAAVTTGDSFSNLTVDFGFYTVSLGDTIWFDADNSGTLDAGEQTAPAGVVVELLDESGVLIASTTTDADGTYEFTGLAEGEYSVRLPATNFVAGGPLDGFISSTGNGATGPDPDDDVDNDDNGTQNGLSIVSDPVSLSAGDEPSDDATSNTSVDFGVIPAGSIGSTVFEDTNSNGQLDAGEVGIPNVTVNLLDADGNVIATTTTDSDGNYLFGNLPPGDYVVEFVPPPGRTFTIANAGADGSDSDANPTTGRTGVITLGLGEDIPTVFAGVILVQLPTTGSGGVSGILGAASGLILLGLALLVGRRRTSNLQ